ncbi:MAG TPA: DUF2203 domain-containing protein [Phototrophicaceae bacterium]|nr:DUF2203 domain-containing protein [Phototrophicaceae bacterium]
MFNFYTTDKANEFLPEIKKRFDLIIGYRNQIVIIQNELNDISSKDYSFKLFFEKKIQLNKTITLLYKQIEEIEELGILIKSLDEGLIDFPSLRFNEEVWLCWNIGEEKIKFWHGKNEGFIGRKPLSVKGNYNEDNLEDLR